MEFRPWGPKHPLVKVCVRWISGVGEHTVGIRDALPVRKDAFPLHPIKLSGSVDQQPLITLQQAMDLGVI